MTQAKSKFNKRALIVIAFLLVFALYNIIICRSEYLQIIEIGENYSEIFKTNITYKYSIMAIVFVILFALVIITNYFIQKGLKAFFEAEKKQMPKLPSKSIALIVSAISAIFTSDIIINKAMLFINNTWFGTNDPIFGNDIGYYIFQKPFIEMLLLYAIVIFIGLAVYTIIYYIVAFNIHFDGIELSLLKKSTFLKQIIAYIIIIAICASLFYVVGIQNILFGEFIELSDTAKTSLNGAGFTDVTIKLWGDRIFALVILVCVCLGIHFFKKEKYKKAVASILIIPRLLNFNVYNNNRL